MKWLAAAGLGLLLGVPGCASDEGPEGDPQYGVQVVDSEDVAAFYTRALAFYERLTNRRVNTYATFQDPILRAYFRDEQAYSDYYADIARSIDDAHIEQNRPLYSFVDEFLIDGPGRARVRVRLIGKNSLPLRRGLSSLAREDRWERYAGQWWIVPGKL